MQRNNTTLRYLLKLFSFVIVHIYNKFWTIDTIKDVDVLSGALEALGVRADFRARLELTAPWGFDGERRGLPFYAVVRGTCWLEVPGSGEPLHLMPGDFAFLPHGGAHVMRDSRTTRAVPFEELAAVDTGDIVLRAGGGGAVTAITSGSFLVSNDDEHDPLLSALPQVIHLSRDGSSARADAALHLLVAELAATEPAGETISRRLAEALFAIGVRGQLGIAGGWLKAVADPQIGHAIALMHASPHEPWTIESLATRLGISRAGFAARFHAVTGEPPLTYLTRYRMRRAAKQLRSTTLPMAEIARAAAYENEAAFNNAFKRTMGVAPGKYRRGAEPGTRAAVRPKRERRETAAPPKRDWWFID